MRFSCSTQSEPNDGVTASSGLNWESVECTMKMYYVFPSFNKIWKEDNSNVTHFIFFRGGELHEFLFIRKWFEWKSAFDLKNIYSLLMLVSLAT